MNAKKQEIRNAVALKFANAEYKVKYCLSDEECRQRKLINFHGMWKDEYINGRASCYKGHETAQSLEIQSIFKKDEPFYQLFVEEAGFDIPVTMSIDEIVNLIWLRQKSQALCDILQYIKAWGFTQNELFPPCLDL